MLELGVKFLISYFIGSLMGSMIMGKIRGGVDIRTMGSGNAGGTNALRTQGMVFALGVVIIDIGKGAIGAGIVPELNVPFIAEDPTLSRTWLTICCATAAVLGLAHNLLRDRGGAWARVAALSQFQRREGCRDIHRHAFRCRAAIDNWCGGRVGMGTGHVRVCWIGDDVRSNRIANLSRRHDFAGRPAAVYLFQRHGHAHHFLAPYQHPTNAGWLRTPQRWLDDFSPQEI